AATKPEKGVGWSALREGVDTEVCEMVTHEDRRTLANVSPNSAPRKIPRREFIKEGAVVTAAAAASVTDFSGRSENIQSKGKRRLNVLYVISDQHQAACMGHEGHPQAITPNMDRLAAQGVRFPSAYTQNPICTPSRMSIFSGQYCHNHGYYGLNGPPPPFDLPSFLSPFRQPGYRTPAIGTVHTPDDPRTWLRGPPHL